MKVADIYNWIDSFAPWDTQLEFDNAGLLVGSPEKQVRRIGVCLDITKQAVLQAAEQKCDLILSHHPVIYSPLRSIEPDGIVETLIKNEIAAICAHTNLDAAQGGVNDCLSSALSLTDVRPLGGSGEPTMARIGTLERELSPTDFARLVSRSLKTAVRLKDCGKTIKTVAVCGGSGIDFLGAAKNSGADAYVTGEVKHHDWLAADITVLDGGHFFTESVVVPKLVEDLKKAYPDLTVVRLEQSAPYISIGENS